MNKTIPLTFSAAAGALLCLPSAQAISYTDRATWEAAVATVILVDEGQFGVEGTPLGANTSIDLQSGISLSFDQGFDVYQVGSLWPTWDGLNTPKVLSTTSLSTIGDFVGGPVMAFGFDMMPNTYDSFTITLQLSGGSTFSQLVSGMDNGAEFFGWTGEAVDSFTITTDDPNGFALGRMVRGEGSPGPNPVPDTGSMLWVSGLLWAGLAGIRRRLGHA